MDICLTNNKDIIKNLDWEERFSFGAFKLFYKQPTKYNHFWSEKNGNRIIFVFGNVYFDFQDSFFGMIQDLFEKHEFIEIMDLNGEFICGCIDEETEDVTIISEKEGIIPLFYNENGETITITTDESLLLQNFSLNDINYHAINDYLRFGCLIGSETMSKSVHKILGGSIFKYDCQKIITTQRVYRFYYKETSDDIEKLMNDVSIAYKKAIEKRVKGKEEDTCIFLSGGLDSRFLLAEMNNTLSQKVTTYSFGQPLSEEVNVARSCAEIGNNPFKWIKVLPSDFVKNVEEYETMVGGADMFSQSYIIDAVNKMQESHFITGYILDAFLGGTFLTQEAIDFEGKLSEYVHTHLKQLKMNVFSKQELVDMCLSEEVVKIFDYDDIGLIEEAKNYDFIPVRDCIQAFAVDNRAKNLVLLREIVPAKFRDCSYVSCDKDFVKAVSHIDAKLRLNHRFYHDIFKKEAPEYAKVIYNNTQLPALAPVEQWIEGSRNEANRERMFEGIIEQYNTSHNDKIYYPHYYSDFNGYSRYDSDWINLFNQYLFTDETIITKVLFKEDKLIEFFNEHVSGKKNRRKELVYITSLEIFFRTTLSNSFERGEYYEK